MNLKNSIRSTIKKAVVAIYRLQCKVLPVRKNIVLFMSNMGKNYSGNPKAIYERLASLDKNKKCKCVWAFTKMYLNSGNNIELPKNCRVVQYGGFKYYFFLAVAGNLVFDTRQEPYLVKRKKCTYIQTWHGTPLKKLGIDITHMNMAGELGDKNESNEEALLKYHDSFRLEAAKWDYLIAQNDFSATTFRRCFDYKKTMLKTGYPRNDKLVRISKQSLEKSNQSLNKDNGNDNRKVLLYAPTWRDDKYLDGGWYRYDSPIDFEKLEKRVGDKCRIIVKLHYLVLLKKGDIPEKCIKSGFVTICGNDTDIADLYPVADGLITDYSSVMFDYSLLKRPMFFFAYDLKQYKDKLRGFYFNFSAEAPGPISESTDKLVEDIKMSGVLEGKGFDYTSNAKYVDFVEKYNKYDDGFAAERIAQIVLGRMVVK